MSQRSIKHVTLSLIFAFAYNFSFSQNINSRNEIISKIDSVVINAIQNYAFPGAVLLIGTRDSVLFNKAYGYHTYDSTRAVQNYHLYDLASVTKVTAATLSLMKLYDDSLLFLDDPFKEYVSGFAFNKRGKSTIRRILTHSAGWRSWIPYYQEMIDSDGNYKKRFFSTELNEKYSIEIKSGLYLTNKNYKYIKNQIKHADLDYNQGYVYSGLFFYLVPELIKENTGFEFTDFLDEKFYKPLNANTLTFNPLAKFPDSLIVPTEMDTFFRQHQIHGKVHDEGAVLMGGISGNAGLFGNALDVYKVWNMFLNDGKIDEVSYLKPSTIALFTTAHFPNENNRRGLGFDKPLIRYDSLTSSVSSNASHLSYGHSGYTGPLIWADPANDLLFVFLANRVYPSRLQRNIYELSVRPVLHDLSYELRTTYKKGYLE